MSKYCRRGVLIRGVPLCSSKSQISISVLVIIIIEHLFLPEDAAWGRVCIALEVAIVVPVSVVSREQQCKDSSHARSKRMAVHHKLVVLVGKG